VSQLGNFEAPSTAKFNVFSLASKAQ